MKIANKKILFLSFFILLLVSCKDVKKDEVAIYRDIDSRGWSKENILDFDFNEDFLSDGLYDIIIYIRHKNTYPYSELILRIDQLSSDGKWESDTVKQQLISNKDHDIWEGRNKIDLIEYKKKIKRAYIRGSHMEISQISEQSSLPGIMTIGIILKKVQKNTL